MTSLDSRIKVEGETDEEADVTGGGFDGGAHTGDLGWWERSVIDEKSRWCGIGKRSTCLEE